MDSETLENAAEEVATRATRDAAFEIAQRYGSAVGEHMHAYKGAIDTDTGKAMQKGLKQIARSKVNPEFEYANKKQQAGFSAEVKAVARKNAESLAEGKGRSVARTDDVLQVNHPLYDIVDIDAAGKATEGTGVQMKFVGSDAESALKLLKGKKFEKYLEADAPIAIPDDFYEGLVGKDGQAGLIDEDLARLKESLEKLKAAGKTDEAAKCQARIAKDEKLKELLRKSGVKNDEAMFAREHPVLSTAADVGKLANEAGVQAAKSAAIIAGSTALIKNVVAVAKGEAEIEEAAKNTALKTGGAAATAYATAFAGAAIKGAMENASSDYIQALAADTNVAAGAVAVTIEVGRAMGDYIKGDITGAECVARLGEKGLGELGGAMGGAAAAVVVGASAPAAVAVVAGFIGSAVGYAAASAVYGELSQALSEYDLAKEQRIAIEAECAEACRMICAYRQEMDAFVEKYLAEKAGAFTSAFVAMDAAIEKNDVGGYLAANADIRRALGKVPAFETMDEFDALMADDSAFTF